MRRIVDHHITGLWPDLARTIKWRRRLIAWITLTFMVGVGSVTATLPDLFDGTAVVAVNPTDALPGHADDAVELAVPRFAALITSASFVQELARAYEVSAGDLDNGLDVVYEPGTSAMEINVRMESPAVASDLANALAAEVVDEARADETVEAEVVATALPEGDADAPPRGKLFLSGLAAGLLVGLTSALVVERNDPRLRTWADVARASGLRVLGQIPRSRIFRTKPLDALAHPDVGSSFRALRANLMRSIDGNEPAIIAVTSARDGEGKTSIAALLAESLARVGTKVLLLDADVYRDDLARRYKLDTHRSLSAALRGTTTVDEAMKRGWVENLYVLASRRDHEGWDLMPSRLPAVLEESLEIVDLVIVDTPPLVGTAEARSVVAITTGVILVVRTGQHETSLVEAMTALDALATPILGVVANGVPGDEMTDFYYS